MHAAFKTSYVEIPNFKLPEEHKLLWYLRNYKNASGFIHNFTHLEKELYDLVESNRLNVFLGKVRSLVSQNNPWDIGKYYSLKKIENYQDVIYVKEYQTVLMHIHNQVRSSTKYRIIQGLCKQMFMDMNRMVYTKVI